MSHTLQKRRVVIITPDIHGPIRNGGIGTAFSALAQNMAQWGIEISIAYALGHHSEGKPIAYWRDYYQARGVKFLPLDHEAFGEDSRLAIDAPRVRKLPWLVYRWLERHEADYDLAIFPEWMGLAYYSLLAKGQGLAFQNLVIAVNSHSPEMWALEGNYRLPDNVDFIDRDFMERESVSRADWVISPSQYMFDWMRQHHWKLAKNQQVIQNLMLTDEVAPQQTAESPQQAKTIVFFGRLEFRKGLRLFCDAIERLPEAVKQNIESVRFLGKAVTAPGGFSSLSYIKSRTSGWKIKVDIITNKDKDQAMAELSKPGVLAVMASLVENSPYTVLECLHHGVRFIASNVGGIPELIASEDAATCLFSPNPRHLATLIDLAVTQGISQARPAISQQQTALQWKAWLEALAPTAPPSPVKADSPLVSICLVHYNRPHYLARALESLRNQTYQNIEIILVDDGSPSPEAIAFLETLEPEFAARGWHLIRQENSYLGAARNRAVMVAQGDYLLFMDDDNIALPYEIEIFLSAAQHSGADILTCISSPFMESQKQLKPRVWLPLGGAPGPGLFRNAFGDANAFWKREAFLATGGYTTDYGVGHEDWELFAQAILMGLHLELVPRALFKYRMASNGMLRSGNAWSDHARSTRAYLQQDPHGLGTACAYAVHRQQAHEIGGTGVLGHRLSSPGYTHLKSFFSALRSSRDPVLRMQFMSAWRSNGLRFALSRALGRSRSGVY